MTLNTVSCEKCGGRFVPPHDRCFSLEDVPVEPVEPGRD